MVAALDAVLKEVGWFNEVVAILVRNLVLPREDSPIVSVMGDKFVLVVFTFAAVVPIPVDLV